LGFFSFFGGGGGGGWGGGVVGGLLGGGMAEAGQAPRAILASHVTGSHGRQTRPSGPIRSRGLKARKHQRRASSLAAAVTVTCRCMTRPIARAPHRYQERSSEATATPTGRPQADASVRRKEAVRVLIKRRWLPLSNGDVWGGGGGGSQIRVRPAANGSRSMLGDETRRGYSRLETVCV